MTRRPLGEVQFDEEERTAHGSYGDVYRGKWRQAGAAEALGVAIKFPRRSIGDRGSVMTGELEALRELTGHAHIVRFLGIHPHMWTTRTGADDADYGLVFEWCDFHLKSRCVVQNANLVELVAQVADALDFLHRRQPKPYIHRDVKPLNILVHKRPETAWSDAQAKLADFGLAKQIEEGEQHASGVGTGAYRAPEVRDGRYYPETDVYALGKTMEELKRESIAPLFKTQSEERTGWVKVQNACLAVGRPHSERLSAANVRTSLRELLRSTVQTLASRSRHRWQRAMTLKQRRLRFPATTPCTYL